MVYRSYRYTVKNYVKISRKNSPGYRKKTAQYTGIPAGNPYTILTVINGIQYSYTVGNPNLEGLDAVVPLVQTQGLLQESRQRGN